MDVTVLLYLDDAYLRGCDASVVNVEWKKVVVDRTVLYAQGGGQPWDTGRLVCGGEEFGVVAVRKVEGRVVHEVDREGLRVGDKVQVVVDWGRRYALMRCHTAAHIVAGVINKESGALITGNQLDVGRGRIDFDVEDFSREKMEVYVEMANEVVRKDLPVDVWYVGRSELEKFPDIFKLAKEFPASIQRIRVVDIRGFDRQADGGTHVRSTGEVGEVVLTSVENKGKQNRRLYFSL